MGEGVDAEGGLLNEKDAEDTGIDEATGPVVPAETANEGGNNQSHGDDRLDVVAVLPNDNGVIVEIGDVGTADTAGVLLHDHPADVAVEQTFADGVRILLGIGVTVVRTMETGPPPSAALDSGGATSGKEDLEGKGGLVGGVSPQAMVAGGDTEASEKVVEHSEDGRLHLKRYPVRGDEAREGNEDDECGVEPVDVLVPVLGGDGLVGDICWERLLARPDQPAISRRATHGAS